MRTTSTAVILVLATPPKQKAAGTSNRSKYWLHQIQPYFGTAAGQDLIQLALYPKTPISDLPQEELHWLHTDVSKYDAGGLAEILAKFNPQALFLSGCPNFTHLEAGWNAKIPLVFWQKENGKQPANLCFIQNFYRSLGQNQPIGAAFTEANMQASIKDGKKFEKARIYDDMGKIPKEPFPGGGLLIGSKGRKLMDQTFFPADYVAEKTSPTRELRPPRTKLHSDHWSQEDFLGYELYANVITQLINDQESIPPLTIAVIAPWGQGKTTLMQYIKRQVEQQHEVWTAAGSQAKPSSIRRLFRQLNQLQTSPKNFDKVKKWIGEGTDAQYGDFIQKKYPTVWFNPWEYQSSDQVWSGMAHAIINQLVDTLSDLEQEKFWFKLRLRRVDRNEVRREVHRTVLLQVLPFLALTIFSVLLIFLGLLFKNVFEDSGLGLAFTGTGGVLSILFTAVGWIKRNSELRKGLAQKYEQLFKPPNYESKLGLFHEINSDLDRVMDLLVSPDLPLVIFIDDLDRCAHSRVVEVIEAINLMMNGRFRDRCYFILGMDAEVVAAALDVAYKDVHGKLSDRERQLGSVGWYFLDKFIQLPFVIPTLNQEDKEEYLSQLFDAPVPSPEVDTIESYDPEQILSAAENLWKNYNTENTEKISTIRGKYTQQKRDLDFAFLKVAFQKNRDSEEILTQVRVYAPYLQPSPRSLKRFTNMLRFYTSIQQLRETKGQKVAQLGALAKWLTISLRWPLLVRWIQYAYESSFIDRINYQRDATPIVTEIPQVKAHALDQVIQAVKQYIVDSGDEDASKAAYFSQWLGFCDDNSHLPWLSDRDLYKILIEDHGEDDQLENALDCGVW